MMKNMFLAVSCLFATSALIAMESPATQKLDPNKATAMARQGAKVVDIALVTGKIEEAKKTLAELNDGDVLVYGGEQSPARIVEGKIKSASRNLDELVRLRELLLANVKTK